MKFENNGSFNGIIKSRLEWNGDIGFRFTGGMNLR